jgi:hypothetical protein
MTRGEPVLQDVEWRLGNKRREAFEERRLERNHTPHAIEAQRARPCPPVEAGITSESSRSVRRGADSAAIRLSTGVFRDGPQVEVGAFSHLCEGPKRYPVGRDFGRGQPSSVRVAKEIVLGTNGAVDIAQIAP